MHLKRFQFPALIGLGTLIGYVAATANWESMKNETIAPTELQFAGDPNLAPPENAPCCADGLNRKLQITRSTPIQSQQRSEQ